MEITSNGALYTGNSESQVIESYRTWMPGERNSETHIRLHLHPSRELFLKAIIPYPGKDGHNLLWKGNPSVAVCAGTP